MLSYSNFELITVFLICSALAYFIFNFKRKYDFWKDRNVPQVGFSMDYIVNFWKHRQTNVQNIYKKLKPLPYGGFYQHGIPYLMVLDLELIRTIYTKDFSHFTDRGMMIGIENDPILNLNIFNLTGQKWKNIRAKLNPIFTSGNLKRMSVLMNECTRLLDNYLERTVDKSDETEIRGLLKKFTTDTVGICVFGLDCNDIQDENSVFRKTVGKMIGKGFFVRAMLLQILSAICPKKVLSAFKLKITHPSVEEFFRSLVTDSVNNNQEAETKRKDFLQLLVNVRAKEQEMLQKTNDGSAPLFDDEVCMANAFIFFAAGFDSVTNTLSHCLYDLALNPEVAERLHDEIKQVQESQDGSIDYETLLKKMPYLECVVSESLRLHPSIAWGERICTKSYKIPDSSLIIEKNTHVLIPALAIRLDPRYFPDPEKYNPDRFSKENKAHIVPGSYLPFGDGPRKCIGYQFALLEMKTALALIIRKYTIHPCAKTEIPLKLNPFSFANTPNKMYLQFRRRKG